MKMLLLLPRTVLHSTRIRRFVGYAFTFFVANGVVWLLILIYLMLVR